MSQNLQLNSNKAVGVGYKIHTANRMFDHFEAENPSKRLNLNFMSDKPDKVSFAIKLRNLQTADKIYEMTKEQQD